MSLISASRFIKIPNVRNCDELSLDQVASMIDASLTPDGNEQFTSRALDEFLSIKLRNNELIKVQQAILNNIYSEVEGQSFKDIDVNFLIEFAQKLREVVWD